MISIQTNGHSGRGAVNDAVGSHDLLCRLKKYERYKRGKIKKTIKSLKRPQSWEKNSIRD